MDELLKFLNEWIEKNGAINATDTDALKKFMTGLGSKIDILSITPPTGSNKLILYGGWNGDVPMWQIAESAANSGQGYYFISQTETGSLLNNDIVKTKSIKYVIMTKIYTNLHIKSSIYYRLNTENLR